MNQSNTIIHKPTTNINGFQIEKIIFDEGNYATLWVTARLNQCIKPLHLVMPFAQLNDILRFSGKMGEKVLLKMLDIMMHTKKPPYVLEITADLGSSLIITTCKLQLTDLLDGQSVVEGCYFVTDVMPINIIQQAKNLHQHLQDFNTAALTTDDNTNNLSHLSKMYAYYLGFIELDILDSVARDRAQLTDNRLFKLAASAYEKTQTAA
jgi:hypothetical protein